MHRKVLARFRLLTAFLHIKKTYKKHSQKHAGASLHITSLISPWGKVIRSLKSHILKQRPLAVHGRRWSAYSAPPPPDQSGFSASLLTRDHNRILFCLVPRENRHCGWFPSVANSKRCRIQAPRTSANLPHKKNITDAQHQHWTDT